jgi:small conductance mechanosensitive channel
MFELESIQENLTNFITTYGLQVLGAIAALIIGLWLVGYITRVARKAFDRSKLDKDLQPFLLSLINVGLKVMVLLAVAGMFGIETTSFIAVFSALAFAIGIALQGSLGHFASGVVTSNVITNISGQGIIGAELTFGISYNDSIDQAREIILRVGKECPTILYDPAQGVVVAELGDSSVNLATRPFCKSEHYWDTFFYMQENVKKAFDAEGVSIPFPQVYVHMDQ